MSSLLFRSPDAVHSVDRGEVVRCVFASALERYDKNARLRCYQHDRGMIECNQLSRLMIRYICTYALLRLKDTAQVRVALRCCQKSKVRTSTKRLAKRYMMSTPVDDIVVCATQ